MELFRQGVNSYWDARAAMLQFEESIRDVARQILEQNLDRLPGVTGDPAPAAWDAIEGHGPLSARALKQVFVGAGYRWRHGIRLGIGWRRPPDAEAHGVRAVAALMVRVFGLENKNALLQAWRNAGANAPNDQVFLDVMSQVVPYEVGLWQWLDPEPTLDAFERSLGALLDRAVTLSNHAGPLNRFVP
jgi:hypothetical protein